MKDVLTVTELSNMMRVSTQHLYCLVKDNKIPHFKFGKSIRFKKKEIEEWTKTSFSTEKVVHSGSDAAFYQLQQAKKQARINTLKARIDKWTLEYNRLVNAL